MRNSLSAYFIFFFKKLIKQTLSLFFVKDKADRLIRKSVNQYLSFVHIVLSYFLRRSILRQYKELLRNISLIPNKGFRVVLVGASDGGAGVIVDRLFTALSKMGVDVWWLSCSKNHNFFSGDDLSKLGVHKHIKLNKYVYSHIARFISLNKDSNEYDTLFSSGFSGMNIREIIDTLDPNALNFHWINRDFMYFPSLKSLQIPSIFTLHDHWYATGGCHISSWKYSGDGYDNCDEYLRGCVSCKRVIEGDTNTSSIIGNIKKEVYTSIEKCAFVGVSNYTSNLMSSSYFLSKQAKIQTIHNFVDTEIFKPQIKMQARQALGLPLEGKLILLSQTYGGKLKGGHLLNQAMNTIKDENVLKKISVVKIGNGHLDWSCDVPIIEAGMIRGNALLALYMSAVDVVAVPSLFENLPNMVMEPMSCGTPAVAFAVGGIPDLIDHKINGYLAKPYDVNDLAEGIKWVLDNENIEGLQRRARDKVLANFTEEKCASEYLKLFKQLAGN